MVLAPESSFWASSRSAIAAVSTARPFGLKFLAPGRENGENCRKTNWDTEKDGGVKETRTTDGGRMTKEKGNKGRTDGAQVELGLDGC